MTHYQSVYINFIKLTTSWIKITSKNENGVTIRLLSNMIGDADDKTNIPDELLSTNRQVSRLFKEIANSWSADKKLPSTQLYLK